jgi:hypothetical protein
MSKQSASAVATAPRVIPEKADRMAHANLRIPETDDSWADIGDCLDFARRSVGWTIDELAGYLPPPKGSEKRDAGQVQRWIQGKEQTQIAVVFAVEPLRGPFVIALAKLAAKDDSGVVIRTTVELRQKVG